MMEAALALAMVGIIGIAAVALYGAVTRTFTTTRKSAMLTDRSQAAIDYLLHELRSIGGNGIPAYAGVFVEDACSTRGSGVVGFPDGSDSGAGAEQRTPFPGKADRLTTFTALPNVPACPISAADGPLASGEGTASFILQNPPGVCCFTMGATRPFVRTVMLMKDDFYRPVLLTNSSGTCVFQWQDIAPASMRIVPTTGDMTQFANGEAVLVDFRTYYLDADTHDLILHMDRGGQGGTMNGYGLDPTVTGERLRVLDGVYDFQVSLGYDLDGNGETSGGAEWVYDAPGEGTSGLVGFNLNKLKLVRIELVVGMPTGATAPARAFSPSRTSGPLAVPAASLRAVGTIFAPRNTP